MLSLNWTFIAQLVMFLAAMAILTKGLFKPIVAVITRRESQTDKPYADAAALKEDAAAARQTVEQKLVEVRQQTDRLRHELLGAAANRERDILGEARQRAQQEAERANKDLTDMVDRSKQELRAEAEQLADLLAGKLLETH